MIELSDIDGYSLNDLITYSIESYKEIYRDSNTECVITREKLNEYLEHRIIEIAPLAFMRGRTLDNAFVILDEAQNSTHQQMKMFLTRMGKSAKFIITGDETQIDLPSKQPSGLLEALKVLKSVKGISVIKLDDKDVIRHELVKKIIKAYKLKQDKNE